MIAMSSAKPMRDFFGILLLSLLVSIFLFLLPLSRRTLEIRHHDDFILTSVPTTPRQSAPVFTNVEQPAFLENPVLEIDFLSDISSPIPRIPAQSLTAILPVSSVSSLQLPRRLLALIGNGSTTGLTCLHEIILICPDTITNALRMAAASLFASPELENKFLPDVSLHPFREKLHFAGGLGTRSSLYQATFEAARNSVSTPWILILDEAGLDNLSHYEQAVLLDPPGIPYAAGILGHAYSNVQSLSTEWGVLRPAAQLTSPIVVPLTSLHLFMLIPSTEGSTFRLSPAMHTPTLNDTFDKDRRVGTLVLIEKPNSYNHWKEEESETPVISSRERDISAQDPIGVLLFLLPSEAYLDYLLPIICNSRGLKYGILLYNATANLHRSPIQEAQWSRNIVKTECMITYDILTPLPTSPYAFHARNENVLAWIKTSLHANAVIFAVQEDNVVSTFLKSARFKAAFSTIPTVILVSETDLPYLDWISSLSVTELKSMSDFMTAIARYFGDTINLRVNIEQDCDNYTLKIVKKLTWPFGAVLLNHRVLHAGLLPAVVESWYPKDDHTYGVILEDDIEVSPMFYAWIKMALLKYRYGTTMNRSPYLFGISLYQHKHMELRTQGRKAFNPRAFFRDAGLPFPNTPYLSQVPCSWGALYFPEHWREFHDYLSVRLPASLPQSKLEQAIVPNVRSNYWSQSWKKFFIELVYLRGYLMLYPNFPDFVSLSTNHLEVGSHVKSRSQARRDLFTLPLMRPVRPANGSVYWTGLLQLPNRRLPQFLQMPMINLTGTLITSHAQLVEVAQSRRRRILDCASETKIHDIPSLMCVNGPQSAENSLKGQVRTEIDRE
ncbi:hypothetical protein CVT24_006743 [Panaeolus cyanescens]|uniref:Glycosyl transferase 64 domain-containing protein n=1 Tax=Panaeolus cyanescens TaxID=181874 RepID=A0A409V9D7_9AGAR|nr:hypothetical protein CVT24_006743 [Panaeolus cyanescens]